MSHWLAGNLFIEMAHPLPKAENANLEVENNAIHNSL